MIKKFLFFLIFFFVFSYSYADCFREYEYCGNTIDKEYFSFFKDFTTEVRQCWSTHYFAVKYKKGKAPDAWELRQNIRRYHDAFKDTDKDIDEEMGKDYGLCLIFIDYRGDEIYSKRF